MGDSITRTGSAAVLIYGLEDFTPVPVTSTGGTSLHIQCLRARSVTLNVYVPYCSVGIKEELTEAKSSFNGDVILDAVFPTSAYAIVGTDGALFFSQ